MSVDEDRQRVRREWTDPATVAAWRRWRAPFAAQSRGLTDAVVEAAEVRPGLHVLDLASGAGEPALTLAERVGPEGRVTASDLGEGMLAIVRDGARERGLANVDLAVADAHDLPFGDGAFDRVTSRLGVMFFVDARQALGECRRVLAADGRIALVVWGEVEANPFFGTVLAALGRRTELPRPPADSPGPLRFSAAGSLTAALEGAGFGAVDEQRRIVPYRWPGPPEQLWQHFRDVVAPLRPVFESLTAAEQEAVAEEVIAAYADAYDGRSVDLSAEIVIASAGRG